MNCEQVEELLSAFLDGTLALGETAETADQLNGLINAHLASCIHCSTMLADFRRFDALLAQMPHVSPSPALRKRIFTSPEFLELTGTANERNNSIIESSTIPSKSVRRDTPGRPQLVALPGGRRNSNTAPTQKQLHPSAPIQRKTTARRQRTAWGLRIMQVTIAATLLLTIGIGGLIGWNIWLQKNSTTRSNDTIIPPAGPPARGPLSAGMHFVFLRDNSLWSAPADGSTRPSQLTPKGTIVAANWAISPPLPGRFAGDMLAYIDLQQARVHTLRSDGQSDTIVNQPLLKAGTAPSSIWDTSVGTTILNSLAWSSAGSMLAFIADPVGTGMTGLYIFSTDTGTIQAVPLPMKGSVSHPVWSPDGIRVAFELNHNGVTSILDYNTQNHGLLVITDNVNSKGVPGDNLLALDWSPDTDTPTITWSVGVIGHVHSIWLRRVGNGGNASPQLILQGDYVQALYSRVGHDGTGSWLCVNSYLGKAANLWRIDITPGSLPVALTSGKQVNYAQWSPDGTQIDYLDSILAGVGRFHVVNATTAQDTFIANGVTNEPAPAWSADGLQLVYSTGTQTVVVDMQAHPKLHPLPLRGLASTFTWSSSSAHQLIVSLSDGQPGVYLVDTSRNSSQQVDQQSINAPIFWTEIP